MMGSRGWKGAAECDALSRRTRRTIIMSPGMIRKAKRSFWKRTRRELAQAARREAHIAGGGVLLGGAGE
jgi:hypothetical protein